MRKFLNVAFVLKSLLTLCTQKITLPHYYVKKEKCFLLYMYTIITEKYTKNSCKSYKIMKSAPLSLETSQKNYFSNFKNL